MRVCVAMAVLGVMSGCAWTPKPYANDPHYRTRKALPGDPYEVPDPQPPVFPEPPPPPPPDGLDRVAGTT